MALRRYLYDEPCHSEKQNSKRATPVVSLVSLRHPDPTATPLILRQQEAISRAMLLLCREQAWGFSTANEGSYLCFGQETRLLWQVNIARPLHKRKHQNNVHWNQNGTPKVSRSFTKSSTVHHKNMGPRFPIFCTWYIMIQSSRGPSAGLVE